MTPGLSHRVAKEHRVLQIRLAAQHPTIRIGVVIVAALVILLAIIAIIRPEMMSMKMIHDLIVGPGL